MNLCNLLELAAAEQPDHPAVIYPSGQITYNLLSESVRRLAHGLQQSGLSRGDRIAIMLPNVPHFIIAYHAILRVGGVVAPVDPSLRAHELALLLEEIEAAGLIIWGPKLGEVKRNLAQLPVLKFIATLGGEEQDSAVSLTKLISRHSPITDPVEIEEEDPAALQFCAGSTCRPKVAEATHGALAGNAAACREALGVTGSDILLAALPLAHPIGQTFLMNMVFSAGSSVKLYPKFDVEAAGNVLRRGEGTIFVSLPSMLRRLCDYYSGEEFAVTTPVRLTVSGGGRLSEDTLKEFERKFCSYTLECYTLSEGGPVCSFNQWRNGRRVGSLGRPLPGIEMVVFDANGKEAPVGQEGEIVVRGGNLMQGYLGRPRLTAERFSGGWFHTGDFGRMDINGFFYLTGRRDGRLVRSGYTVHSSEIENIFLAHPDIEDVAIVPLPDPLICDEIKACVVLRKGASVTTEQLFRYCSERMADYKAPDVIRFYRDIPRDADGKPDYTELSR